MSSLFDLKDSLDPCYNFVRAGIRGLIEVDKSTFDIFLEVATERRGSEWKWRIVIGSDV